MAGFTHYIKLGVALMALAAPAWVGAAPGTAACARSGDAAACRRIVSIPTTLRGTLESAAGIDDYAITVRTNAGGKVYAYCDGHCDLGWFDTDANEAISLKRSMRGRKVIIDVATEHNQGRIAGPDRDEKLLFVKRIRLQK